MEDSARRISESPGEVKGLSVDILQSNSLNLERSHLCIEVNKSIFVSFCVNNYIKDLILYGSCIHQARFTFFCLRELIIKEYLELICIVCKELTALNSHFLSIRLGDIREGGCETRRPSS